MAKAPSCFMAFCQIFVTFLEILNFTFTDYKSRINLPSNNNCMMRVKFNFSLVAKRSEATDGDGFYPHFVRLPPINL